MIFKFSFLIIILIVLNLTWLSKPQAHNLSIETVVLKEFELSVNIESISFQTKVEHVDLWLAITKSYLKINNFEVYAEKKVSKELCTQFKAKSKSNWQIYIVNFFSSGSVAINSKDFRKELLEIHIPKLEELYGITFDIKGVK